MNFLVRELTDAHRDPSLEAIAENMADAQPRRVRDWPGALRVPVDEEAVRDMIISGDEEVVISATIAQCEKLADACAAAITRLE